MSKEFAIKVLDTIYAKAKESGHGGEYRISRRQYEIVSEHINFSYCDPSEVRSWAYGNLGKYFVELHDEGIHGCCCEKIYLRDEAEVEAERKAEAAAKAKEEEAAPAPEPEPSDEAKLLAEIRDLLAKK
jgi:hypothetical protein